MFMEGDLKVHKQVKTRPCRAVYHLNNGDLAIWDDLPEDFILIGRTMYETFGWLDEVKAGEAVNVESSKLKRVIHPDIILSADEYEGVTKEGHYLDRTSPQAIRDRAERREDVDEEQLPDQI